MDPATIVTLVSSLLALIENVVLPLLGSGSSATAVSSAVSALEKFMPLIEQAIQSVPTIYTAVKGIITALRSDPSTLPAQLQTLDDLDARLDAAFEAAASAVDPDAPGASAAGA